nr:hypothetical protein [Tanacetum cinerariifolium]
MKNLSRTPRGVLVGPKVGFKPVKQVYRYIFGKKNLNIKGNKKKDAEPTLEVSNSNPFDVLNSVENDVDLATNGGTPNLISRKANSSGFLSRNIESSSTSNTPMVDSSGDHDSKDEVASVDNDMANFLASKKDGYGQDIPHKIQDICDNFDIIVQGRKKK